MNPKIRDGPPASRVGEACVVCQKLGERVMHPSLSCDTSIALFTLFSTFMLSYFSLFMVSAHSILQLPLGIQR